MELGKYKRALKASTRPKHLRRVVYQPEIGDTDVDFPTPDQPFNRFAGGGLVRKLFAKLKRELPVGNDTETLMQAKALTKAVEGKPMNDAEIDMLMRSSIMDDTMQRMVDDMDMSETEAYDTLVKTMQIGKPQNREGFSQGGEAKTLNKLLETDRDKFLTNMTEYTNKYFSGNLSRASESLGQKRDKIKAIYDRRGIKPPSEIKIQTQVVAGGENPADFSTKLKKQPNILESFKKENVFADANELAAKFGVDVSTKRKRDTFIDYLNRAGVKKKNITGNVNHYNIGDAAKKLPKTFERKRVFGERVSSSQRLKFEQGLDKNLLNFGNRIKKEIRDASRKFNVYVPNAVEDVGHAVSLQQAGKYPKLFKNSNTLSLQSLVFQDPEVNRRILATRVESKYDSIFKQLNDLVGKKVTPESQAKIVQLNKQLAEIRNGAIDKIKIAARDEPYFRGQEKRIPLLKIDIPQIGEKFQSQNLKADMSVVDDYFRFGNVNQINPEARVLADLTPEQLDKFEANVIAQNSDNLQKFYTAAGFPKEEVSELGELLETRVGKNPEQVNAIKNKLATINTQDATNAIANLACPGQYADGGRVKFSRGSECYAKGLQLLDDAKFGDAKAKAKVTKGMKALKVLGGIGTEILFETAFLLPSIAEGKPLDVLIGESTLGYLGLGTSEDEKTIEMSGYDPKVIRYIAAKRAYEDNKELPLKQEQMVPGLDDDFYQNMEERKKANRAVYEKFVRSNDREAAAAAHKLAQKKKQESYDENKKGLPARTAQAILEQLNKTFIGQTEPGEVFDLAEFQDGGRVGFENGGFTRRGFLKALGALAAVIAGLRTGKGTKVVPKTTTAKQVVENAGKGTPEWFAPLVDKIKTEGIDVPPENVARTSGRESVTKLEVKNPESNTTDSYYLFENPDTGEVRIDVDALGVGANDGEFSLYMRPRRVEGLTDEGIQQIDEGEFFVTEDRAVGRMNGPDDFDIDLEALDTDLSGSASNWHQLEEFATGKTDKAAQTEQLKKKDFIERNPGDDIENRYGVYDPPEPDDYD